jgi:ergothioneine biosynthesis protein EgtB
MPTVAISLEHLLEEFTRVRQFSHHLCQPLATEDYVVQSMADASPTKWHLAHTTWFFETFILKEFLPNYQSAFPGYHFILNSYYNALGERHARPKRGLLSRPTVKEVYEYRAAIDAEITALLAKGEIDRPKELAEFLTLGLHHEQQHQELMVTDFKHALMENPLEVVYRKRPTGQSGSVGELTWTSYKEGLYEIGFGGSGFSFDNEGPRHRQFLENFQLANRLVTNGEYLQFMQSAGYADPRWWLSAGFSTVQTEGWKAPLYWKQNGNSWIQRSLAGEHEIDLSEPVCHLSYFEADAYARWAGARLPSEAEWEVAAALQSIQGNFAEGGRLHPVAQSDPKHTQMFGDVWEWTHSNYTAYPGFQPAEGAVGEYNGKFMCNQYVLRGGSCATPQSHIRPSYRNFFPSDARWQFSGIRLARGPIHA